MPYFTLKSFSVRNNITFQKMEIDPSDTEHLYTITYDYDTYVKDGVFHAEEFHNFLKQISNNFPDVIFTVIYSYNIHCAHCCHFDGDSHKDDIPPCIYTNELKIVNSVITDNIRSYF